jgi:Lrp/AsnC family leucine-responsive transcriptional regulator
VSGDFDYLIKARIPEMTEYRRLLGEILHVADGGQSKSYVVMEEVKETLAVSIAR